MSELRLFLSLFVMASLCLSCVSAPETKRRQLMLVPEAQVESMGLQAYQEMKSKTKTINSGPLVREVVSIGERIAAASGKNLDWEISVFDDPKMVNAFCLPGGKIGVYTGIIPVAENNAALAAVMAHEVAHATLRHGSERMSQSIASQTGLSLAALGLGDSRYRDLILGALGIGVQVGFQLPYSRLHEEEADKVGLIYLAKAGFDPREAVGLWERMAAKSQGAPPEFLSTHPAPGSRIQYLKGEMAKVLPYYQNAANKVPTKALPR